MESKKQVIGAQLLIDCGKSKEEFHSKKFVSLVYNRKTDYMEC